MATAVAALQRIQIGEESTKGTLVPATKILRGDFTVTEEQDVHYSPYPAGVLANVGEAGTILRKGTILRAATELTAEEILWPLHLGVRGALSPSASGSDQTWTCTPQLTTEIKTLDSATLEWVEADGSTNHVAYEAGYALCRSFGWTFGDTKNIPMDYELFARARQTSTPTGSLAVITGREPLTSALTKVYLDTSGAGLGGTQLTGTVRSGKFACVTGVEPDYTTDGRSDKDFTQHKVSGPLSARLSLVMELNATSAAYVASYWRTRALAFVRLLHEGSVAATSLARKVQVDGAYRFISPPAFSSDGQTRLVSFELESVYDATWTKTLEFVVVNAQSGI